MKKLKLKFQKIKKIYNNNLNKRSGPKYIQNVCA